MIMYRVWPRANNNLTPIKCVVVTTYMQGNRAGATKMKTWNGLLLPNFPSESLKKNVYSYIHTCTRIYHTRFTHTHTHTLTTHLLCIRRKVKTAKPPITNSILAAKLISTSMWIAKGFMVTKSLIKAGANCLPNQLSFLPSQYSTRMLQCLGIWNAILCSDNIRSPWEEVLNNLWLFCLLLTFPPLFPMLLPSILFT